MSSVRPWATIAAAAVVLFASAVLALALAAAPASAYSQWAHDGATGCVCHTMAGGTPTDATCITCHTGFQSYPGDTCWTCHYPGQKTWPYWTTTPPTPTASPSESPTATPSATPTATPTPTPTETTSPCSQECHLYNSVDKQYDVPSTHGANPHLGSTSACLDCHSISVSWNDPDSSPHHSGQATGFTQCGACHSSQQKHVGKVACVSCHTDATAFHLYEASSPKFKKCGSCHSMKHAGKKVSTSKCASCHKGTRGRSAQHSSSVTKQFVCSGCHKQKLHARSVSKKVKNCRTCHRGKYHAAQRTPPKSTCTACHRSASRHTNGFQCTLCHRRAVHATRPSAIN